MFNHLPVISKVSDALYSFYVGKEEKLLSMVNDLDEYFKKNKFILDFLVDRLSPKDKKVAVVKELSKSLDKYFSNTLFVLIDKGFIFYLDLFLVHTRGILEKALEIKNVYIYSSYPILDTQKKKIEELWKKRLSSKKVNFIYAIDKSLRMGIKVQIDTFIEEFSLNTNLLNVKLKLDSVLL